MAPRVVRVVAGAGRGNHFAMMEAHLIASTIARQWRFRLAQHDDIVEEPLVTLRPRGGVHVEVQSR